MSTTTMAGAQDFGMAVSSFGVEAGHVSTNRSAPEAPASSRQRPLVSLVFENAGL